MKTKLPDSPETKTPYCDNGRWLSFPKDTPGLDDALRVRADYDHDANGRITQPGKFEGEPIFAPYFWQVGLEGFADSDNGKVYTFRFVNGCTDFALWPELKRWLGRKRTIRLFEDSQGFVYCR